MMAEYIEREAARNIFTPPLRDPESLDFWEWLQSEIDAIHAADVRPVVLCRDCKYCRRVDEFEYWCDGFCSPARLVRTDDFCSHGKRKERLT